MLAWGVLGWVPQAGFEVAFILFDVFKLRCLCGVKFQCLSFGGLFRDVVVGGLEFW